MAAELLVQRVPQHDAHCRFPGDHRDSPPKRAGVRSQCWSLRILYVAHPASDARGSYQPHDQDPENGRIALR
jgi:hypothetical protein